MRPDATVNINGLDWNVFFVDKTHEELVGEDGEQNAYGIALLREGEIYIDERKDRPEWSCVGMIGVIPLRDDGAV